MLIPDALDYLFLGCSNPMTAMREWRRSATLAKRIGDRGHPCLMTVSAATPSVESEFPIFCTFRIYSFCMYLTVYLTQFSSTPHFWSAVVRKDGSSEGKAALKSKSNIALQLGISVVLFFSACFADIHLEYVFRHGSTFNEPLLHI